MTAIIILNWNGEKDTVECINSIFECTDNFFIIIIDNHSELTSFNCLINKLEENKYSTIIVKDKFPFSINNKDILIYRTNENSGFAKGNNIGYHIAKKYSPKYIMLLNNDTLVTKNFLEKLIEFKSKNKKYIFLTPLIYYYQDKNCIWNAGGKLKCGFRKYYYARKSYEEINKNFINKGYIEISFITGCCLFFQSEDLDSENIFTEKFFFGEEDFELSLRMKKSKRLLACVLDSHIYHKVGIATKNKNNIGKLYIHYLNRFIDIKQNYTKLQFIIWELIYLPFMILLFLKKGLSFKLIKKFISNLLKESKNLEFVSKSKFEYHLKNGL